ITGHDAATGALLWEDLTASADALFSLHPDGDRLAVRGADYATIEIHPTAAGSPPQVFGRHARLTALTFSRDGRWLGSASAEGTVKLWQVDGAGERLTLMDREGVFLAVVFSPEGDFLAATDSNERLFLWETSSGHLLQTLPAGGSR